MSRDKAGSEGSGAQAMKRAAVAVAVLVFLTAALFYADPTSLYDWIKAFHVIAVISWMAGMLYLPRLFVYHAETEIGSPQSETFKVMERRLLRAIINPAMMVAWVLHRELLPPRWRTLFLAGTVIAVPTGLIAIQPDLGTAMLVAASGAFVVFLGGIGWWRIVAILGMAAAVAPIGWQFLREYHRDRLRMFLNPEADPLGAGWNIIQSKIAVGSGGLFGKGWGQGSQSRLEFLPEHTTDFVFAVFSEEFGLLGVLLMLSLYLFIVGRSLWIAANARDTWARLLGGALALTFLVYVVVNGGMICGLLPVIGVPMPLMSYGGTSAVTLLAGFGIVMSLHAHRKMMGS